MRLILTPEQSAQNEPHMRRGLTLIGKIERAMFDGTNARFVVAGCSNGRRYAEIISPPSQKKNRNASNSTGRTHLASGTSANHENSTNPKIERHGVTGPKR